MILDSNTGKNRKVFKLSSIDLTSAQKTSLIGFHAFTGNDYNSAFFRKAKPTCWKLMEKKQKFVDTFCNLGVADYPSQRVLDELEEYTSLLYGVKCKEVNEARYTIFERKLSKDKKITDMSVLPPCHQTLDLHIRRANFIAKEWRSAHISNSESTSSRENGWNEQMEPKWFEIAMPDDVEELFTNEDFADEDFSECSDMSDDEN